MMHVGTVLNKRAFSMEVVVCVMVDGRDLSHEFWDVDGEVVVIRLKSRGFLDFAGTGISSIRNDGGGVVRLTVGSFTLHRIHS
jgi:hypothetical protein